MMRNLEKEEYSTYIWKERQCCLSTSMLHHENYDDHNDEEQQTPFFLNPHFQPHQEQQRTNFIELTNDDRLAKDELKRKDFLNLYDELRRNPERLGRYQEEVLNTVDYPGFFMYEDIERIECWAKKAFDCMKLTAKGPYHNVFTISRFQREER